MKFHEMSAPNIMFDIRAMEEFIIWGNWFSTR